MFVLVEEGKPEDPEKNSRSNDKNQQQTQPTCLISLYNYFFGSQRKTHDLLKNATHLYPKSTYPAQHMSVLLWFSMGLWVRIMPQGPYHKVIIISSVAHFSLANLIKLTLCFADRKQQFNSQLFACHPLKRFRLLMTCEIAIHWENISTLLNNWKCSFKTILHERLLLHVWADFKLLAIFCV